MKAAIESVHLSDHVIYEAYRLPPDVSLKDTLNRSTKGHLRMCILSSPFRAVEPSAPPVGIVWSVLPPSAALPDVYHDIVTFEKFDFFFLGRDWRLRLT